MFSVHVLLKSSLENFKHYFVSMWNDGSCAEVWTSFHIAFLWDWNENCFFKSYGHCLVSKVCWHFECSIFTASSFRIWNNSAGIPSPPLALLLVMLPKDRLTSHSSMSGSRWVITTPSRSSGSLRSFLCSSSVYYCHLFLVSSTSVRSISFLSFIMPIFVWKFPLVPLIFSKRSLVFPILLFSSISLHWSLRNAFLSLFAILWNSAFKWVYLSFSPLPFAFLLFTAICTAFSDNHFAFLHFFFLGLVLVTASYTMSRTSIHSSSGTLSIRSNPLNLFCHFHCIIVRDLI